jgi:hypothetical protein
VAGGRGREVRLENPRSLAEAEAISDSVPSVQRKSWSLKMTVQEAVAFLSSKKRTLELLAAGLRKSPE